ncbi:Helix-turn-helix domain-containing protein [Streptomyces sp. WMMB 322]|nr:Helix-turn-helix domain-containing protein [Streptomyces sp. WMMB 322]
MPDSAGRAAKEPLWRHVVGGVLRGERLGQRRTLKDVAEAARISMPYLSEVERGRKEASSEVLAAAAQALGLSLADVLGLVQGELERELERRARRGRPSVVRRVRPSSPGASPADALRVPGGALPDSGAAHEESDDGSATSVSTLSTRSSGTRPAAPRPGDVRLAA